MAGVTFPSDRSVWEGAEGSRPRGLRGRPWTPSDSDPKGPSQCTQAQHTARGAYLSFPTWSSSALWPQHPASHLESPHSLNPEPQQHLPGPHPPVQEGLGRMPALAGHLSLPPTGHFTLYISLSLHFPPSALPHLGPRPRSLVHSFGKYSPSTCVRRSSWYLRYIMDEADRPLCSSEPTSKWRR